MEMTNDQVALLAGLGAIAASVMLMTLSYYLGQSARNRVAEENRRVTVRVESAPVNSTRRSKAA